MIISITKWGFSDQWLNFLYSCILLKKIKLTGQGNNLRYIGRICSQLFPLPASVSPTVLFTGSGNKQDFFVCIFYKYNLSSSYLKVFSQAWHRLLYNAGHTQHWEPNFSAADTKNNMNFRQRIAWLCLALYLVFSFAAVYYFLEIADQFAEFSVEHSKLHDATDSNNASLWRFWQHIGDVPFHILVLILAIPYLQVFAALFYCTLPTIDKNINKCLIPIIGWMYMFQKVISLFRSHGNMDMRKDNPHTVSISWLLMRLEKCLLFYLLYKCWGFVGSRFKEWSDVGSLINSPQMFPLQGILVLII